MRSVFIYTYIRNRCSAFRLMQFMYKMYVSIEMNLVVLLMNPCFRDPEDESLHYLQ